LRVVERDRDEGRITLRIDDPDDLYFLNQLMVRGDRLGAVALRRVETKEDMLRSDSLPRRRVRLVIEVEETEFAPFTDSLRAKGTIVEGPPDIRGHHTHIIEPGSVLDLFKEAVSPAEEQLLEEACEASARPQMVVVGIDDSECTVFRLRSYGLEEVEFLQAGAGGKRFPGEGRWDALFDELAETVRPMCAAGAPVVLVGPSFIKEMAAARLRKEMPDLDIVILNASSGGSSGVREALSKGEGLRDVLRRSRVVKEGEAVQELMSRIGKGSGATYGPSQVERALEMGAVETLLISDDRFRTREGRELMDRARAQGASTMIVSPHHDLGRSFALLGGLGALLRFDPGGIG